MLGVQLFAAGEKALIHGRSPKAPMRSYAVVGFAGFTSDCQDGDAPMKFIEGISRNS